MAEGRRAVFPPNVVQPALARTSVIVKVRCRPSIALRAKGSSFENHSQTGRPPQNVWGLLRLRNIISALRKQVYWLNETADLQGLYSLWDTVERKSKIQANIYKLPHTIQEASTLQMPM